MGIKKTISNTNLVELASKSNWVLDVDDCLYPMSCGLHDFIKGNIVRVFNAVAAYDPKKEAILQKLDATLKAQNIDVPDLLIIRREDLGSAFTPIVKTLAEISPERITDYLTHFYGNAYDLITPNRDLVEAFDIAAHKGIGIYIYTNGPSSAVAGQDAHFQKVMRRHGFEHDVVEEFRSRTYDLMMSVRAGRGKPEISAMQDFLTFANIDPNTALMADDSIKNLKTAAQFGIAPLWTWTTPQAPDAKSAEIARGIRATRVRDTGAALLQIAKAYSRY